MGLVTKTLRDAAGTFLGYFWDDGTAVAPVSLSQGLPAATSPPLVSGTPAPISTNLFGATRVIRQKSDGTDVDETAPQETTPAKSGTATTAQASVANTAPTTPALAALATRKQARLFYKSGGANVYWGTTVGVTTTTGFLLTPGAMVDPLPGYTGDIYLIADAAGPTAVSISQLA